MAGRVRMGRAGAIVGASVAMMLSALPAGADPVTGTVDSEDGKPVVGAEDLGYETNFSGGSDFEAKLFSVTLSDGTKLKTYCVDVNTNIDIAVKLVEATWTKHPNQQSGFHEHNAKINWVLHHGYPVQGTDAIAATLTKNGVTPHDGVSKAEAITATQAAVWFFSDGKKLDEDNPLKSNVSEGTESDVLALYGYLTGDDNVGIGEPASSKLEINPTAASGQAGTRFGDFTVSTTEKNVELTTKVPAGVKVVDKDGAVLAADGVKDGSKVLFDVPTNAGEGAGEFSLTATVKVATGRLFVGQVPVERAAGNLTQSMIVANSDTSKLTATAKATWKAAAAAPAPQARNTNTGELAKTGASILVPLAIGVVLVGAGVGALVFQRRRRRV